jgi:hypothetical protein
VTPEEFVRRVRRTVTDDGIRAYRSHYTAHMARPQDSAEDRFGSAVRRVFDALDEDEQEAFFVIIRQIEVEAVAALFGIFDATLRLRDSLSASS